jgi:hypothetical protein
MESNTYQDFAMLNQALRLEITYLDATGRTVPRGSANAVRRRVLDPQGRVLKERVRTVVRRQVS